MYQSKPPNYQSYHQPSNNQQLATLSILSLQHLLRDQLRQQRQRSRRRQQCQIRHIHLKSLEDPRPELRSQHAVHAHLADRLGQVQLVLGNQHQVGELLGDHLEDGVLDRGTRGNSLGHFGGHTAGRAAAARIGGLVEGGGQERSAGVAEHGRGALKALGAQLLEAERLETGQNVGAGELVVASGDGGGSGQRGVDDLQHLVFVDSLDALAEEHGFDLGVLVQVADFGNHTKTDGSGGETEGVTVAGEDVEEVVGRAVVGLGGGANAAGDGGGHEEEVELGVTAADGIVQVPRADNLGLEAGEPVVAGHSGEESFLFWGSYRLVFASSSSSSEKGVGTHIKTHSSLDNTTDLSFDTIDSQLDILHVDNVTTNDRHLRTGELEILDQATSRSTVSTAAAHEHELASTTSEHPLGHGATETTEAADKEVALLGAKDGVILERKRRDKRGIVLERHNNRARVALGRQRAEGVADLGDVKGLGRRSQVELALAVESNAISQQLGADLLAGSGRERQDVGNVKGRDSDALAEEGRVGGNGLSEARLADMDKTTAVGEDAADAGDGSGLVGKVEDDVDATAFSGLEQLGNESLVILGKDAVRRQVGVVTDGKHLGASELSDADGGLVSSDVASGDDEDGLARLDMGTVVDGVDGGAELKGNARKGGEVLVVGQLLASPGWDTLGRGKVTGSHDDDTVTNSEVLNTTSNLGDNSGVLRSAEGAASVIAVAIDSLQILGVQAHSFNRDLNMAISQLNILDLLTTEEDRVDLADHIGTQTERSSILERQSKLLSTLLLTEDPVEALLRHEPADMKQASVLDELIVGISLDKSLLEDFNDVLSRSLHGGVLMVDIQHEEAKRRLLEHQRTRETVDNGVLGRRGVEETAAGDPDEVGAVVGQSLDVLHLVLGDAREDGVLKLDGRDDAGVRGDDVGGNALERDALGVEAGDLLGLGGNGAVEDMVGVALDDEDLLGKSLGLLGGDLLGSLCEGGAGGSLEGREAEVLELVSVGERAVEEDRAVLIDELLDGLEVLGLGAEDDDVKDLSDGGGLALVGEVLEGEGAILGVGAANQGLALLEVGLETEGVNQELVQVDVEVQDAKSGVLVNQQIKSSAQANSSIISLALRLGSILLNVLRELLGIIGSKPGHIRLPDNAEHRVTFIASLLLDTALVSNLSAPVDLEEDTSLVIKQLTIDADGAKANGVRSGIDLELLLPTNRSAEVHLLDVHRDLSAQLADNTRGAGNDTSLEEGIDRDWVNEILRLRRSATATALAEFRLGQRVRVLLLAGVLDLGERLELALEVQAALGKLAVPCARCLRLHGRWDDGQADLQRSGGGVDLDETVGVRGGRVVGVGADVELVPACVGSRAAGELGRIERGEQLDTDVGLFAAEGQGLGDVDVAKAERGLLLLGHVGDLAHGFNRHGEVASGREDGGRVELVALHPGDVLGLDDIAPVGGDSIASVDLRAEQVVAGILAVAPLDADARLVEDGAAIIPGVVRQVEQHLLLGAHVLARLGAVEGRVDVVDALEGDVVAVQEEVADQVEDGGDGVLAAR